MKKKYSISIIILTLLIIFFLAIYFKPETNHPQDQRETNTTKNQPEDLTWLNNLIQEASSQDYEETQYILKCQFEGETVYQVVAGCCDRGFALYNSEGLEIFKGCGWGCMKGDIGYKFELQKSNCSNIWKSKEYAETH